MEEVHIRVKSLLRMKLELEIFPELSSKNKIAKKAIELVKKGFPRVLSYLSKESVLSSLPKYSIVLLYRGRKDDEYMIRSFGLWLKEKLAERLLFIVIEAILLPFSFLLSILPGPNFFFYILFVVLYFHFKTWLSLRKLKPAVLSVRVEHLGGEEDEE